LLSPFPLNYCRKIYIKLQGNGMGIVMKIIMWIGVFVGVVILAVTDLFEANPIGTVLSGIIILASIVIRIVFAGEYKFRIIIISIIAIAVAMGIGSLIGGPARNHLGLYVSLFDSLLAVTMVISGIIVIACIIICTVRNENGDNFGLIIAISIVLIAITWTITVLVYEFAYAERETLNYGVVNAQALNVRSGPSINTEVVTTLQRNDRVTVLERRYSQWVRIRIGENEGYVNNRYIDIRQRR